jgi:hypothetical protein
MFHRVFQKLRKSADFRNRVSEIFSIVYVIFSTTNSQVKPDDQQALRSILVTAGTVFKRDARATRRQSKELASIGLQSAGPSSMM